MVEDFRQDGPHTIGGTAGAGPRSAQGKRQRRQAMVAGIYLSAAMMALFGASLLTLQQGFIPAGNAKGVALLCFALAAVDVALVQYLKRTWRRRDGL